MVNVSRIVQKIVKSKPMIYECLMNDIINYANLAEFIKKDIKSELGEEVNMPAIVMALRRYAEKLRPIENKSIPFHFNSEIVMKTGLNDLTLVKSPTLMTKLKTVYDMIDYEKGDTLNIIHGNYEITIVISEKYTEKLLKIVKDEKIINKEIGLVSLTMSFSKDFLYTPGILSRITRKLFWENINVYENISTMTELIFIVGKKDAVRAYSALMGLIDEE